MSVFTDTTDSRNRVSSDENDTLINTYTKETSDILYGNSMSLQMSIEKIKIVKINLLTNKIILQITDKIIF